jgi:hypothetical protein
MPMPLDSDEEVLEEEWVDLVASPVASDTEDSGSEVSDPSVSSRESSGETLD